MASAELITELVRAHGQGDEKRWRNLLTQLVAAESRAGHVRQASRLRELLAELDASRPQRSGTLDDRRTVQLARPPRDLADVLDVSYSDTRLDELVLPDDLRRALRRVIDEQRLADRLAAHNLKPRRRLLLHGPPGCGKTMAAHALAGELKLPLARVRLEVLFNKYLGETAATLTDIFDQMNKVRSVYLFDEFDALGKQRGDDQDVGEVKRIVATFLQLLDSDRSDSIIVAATNIGGAVDYALTRRFDDVLAFPMPTHEALKNLLDHLLRVHGMREEDVEQLANYGAGLSFADSKAAIDNARKTAILEGRLNPSFEGLAWELQHRTRTGAL